MQSCVSESLTLELALEEQTVDDVGSAKTVSGRNSISAQSKAYENVKDKPGFTLKNPSPEFPGYFIPFLGCMLLSFLIWGYSLTLAYTLSSVTFNTVSVSCCRSVLALTRLIEQMGFNHTQSIVIGSFKEHVFPPLLLCILCI